MADGQGYNDERTYADRLRGRRFWLPLLALMLATAGAGVAFERSQPSPPAPPSAAEQARVDPLIRSLLHRLGADRLFCGSFRSSSPTTASCVFGAASTRTTVAVFPTHADLLHALVAVERAAVARRTQTRAVTYATSGHRWLITGLWSQTGHYNEVQTVDAQTAQTISKRLHGCLELLPREVHACTF